MASTLKSRAPVSRSKRYRTSSSLVKEARTLRDNKSFDQKTDIRIQANALSTIMIKAETKRPIPRFLGKDAPTHCKMSGEKDDPWLGYEFVNTKESQILKTALTRMFANKQYTFRLATALNMSSSAGGIVNSIVQNSVLAANAEFSALSAVFNECFVERFDVEWQPVSLNNFPLTGLPDGKTVSSLPMGIADLQHNATAYTSMAGMTDNFRYKHANTGAKFKYSWINTEDYRSTVLPQATGVLTQSWCLTSGIANYQGTLQFISQSAPPGLPVSNVLGTFLVEHLVRFRVRE